MAESPKETGVVNQKEDKSLLDAELGKEFLTSWKSLSVAEDDAVDFSFDTVGKGKTKEFNFHKLDVDLTWMLTLTSFHHSKWTCQILISPAHQRDLQISTEIKQNHLMKEILRKYFLSPLILMSWMALILIHP